MDPAAALHIRSHYSLLRAAWSVPRIVEAVGDAGFGAAALTDWASLAGAVEFWTLMRKAGRHPVLGCEFPVQHPSCAGSIVLLVENDIGYTNLCRMLTQAATAGPPRLAGLAGKVDGLIAMTGGKDGVLHRLMESGKPAEASRWMVAMAGVFGQHATRVQLYQQHPGDAVRATRIAEMAAANGLMVVAASEARYAVPGDAALLQAVTSIGTLTLANEVHPDKPARMDGFHLRTADECDQLVFAGWPDAVAESRRLAARCQLPMYDERLGLR